MRAGVGSLLPALLGVAFFFGAHAALTREGKRSCGSDAIPYKIVIDRHGRPELLCETPECFAHPASNSQLDFFYSRRKRHEGFTGGAICTKRFLETVCTGENQWTGGLMETNNGTHRTLKTECCAYDGLTGAVELKTVLLEAGDRYEGGRVSGRAAYDLVKEVRKTVSTDNHVQYIVTIFRMPCEASSDYPTVYTDDGYRNTRINSRRRDPYSQLREDHGFRQYGGRHYAYEERGSYGRRPSSRGRHPAFFRRRLPVEYEYYDDYDYAVPRRPYGRRGGYAAAGSYAAEDRLWPITYSRTGGRPRAFAGEGYDSRDPIAFQTEDGNIVMVEGPQGPAVSVQQVTAPASVYQQPMAVQPVAVAQPTYNQQPLAPAPVDYAVTAAPVPPPAPLPVAQPVAQEVDTYAAPQPLPASGPVGPPVSYVAPPADSYAPAAAPAADTGSYAVAPQTAQQSYSYPYQAPAQPAYPAQAYPEADPGATAYGADPGGACCSQGLNDLFSNMQCFSGDMTVETPTGPKSVRDVQVGDLVLSIDEHLVQFAPVIMLLHQDHEEEATYNHIKMIDGHELKLTDYHLIYVTNCQPHEKLRTVHAKDVNLGECLHVVDGPAEGASIQPRKITHISKVRERGIYAPLTTTGDVMVNGVVASCHSNLAVKSLQQTFFRVYHTLRDAFYWAIEGVVPSWGEHDGSLPLGVGYITSVMPLFLPTSF